MKSNHFHILGIAAAAAMLLVPGTALAAGNHTKVPLLNCSAIESMPDSAVVHAGDIKSCLKFVVMLAVQHQAPTMILGYGGENGPQVGAPGANGKDGTNGKDGKNGTNGKDGKDGATGPQGPEGPQGPAGQDGKDGKDGQDGAPGPQGPAGPPGPQGPQGPAGGICIGNCSHH